MLRCSRSEFGAADLVPAEVALEMRVRLRQMRFGQPQEYAQMEQNEVRKFLSSKSVHNWLSEWNLSHTFSVSNREMDLRSRKVDFCVQCTGEEIDSALGPPAAVRSVPAASPSCAPSVFANPFAFRCVGPSLSAWHFPPNVLVRPSRTFHPPSLMNASTNTQTTETTRTSGGTGGRMHVFRRASLLEEYAQKTLQRLEEREEKQRRRSDRRKGRKGKEATRGGRRRERRWRWLSKCCGGRGTAESRSSGDSGSEEKDIFSSVEVTRVSCRPAKLSSSVTSSSNNEQQKAQPTNIVKRFTLMSSSRSNWEGESKGTEEADDETKRWWGRRGDHGKWGRGDYDNVSEAERWRRAEDEAWGRRTGRGEGGGKRTMDDDIQRRREQKSISQTAKC